MSIKKAVRWSLRPKRVGVLIAKLLLAGSTDLAAQVALQQAHVEVPSAAVESGGSAVQRPFFLELLSPDSPRYPMKASVGPSRRER
jgi:hypothetical protein